MKTVDVVIEGVSPLLINRFTEDAEIPKTMKKSNKKDYGTPRQQAENTAYRDEKTQLLWVPSSWIKGALSAIASDYKLPSSRKSVKSVIGGAVLPVTEKIYFVENYKLKDVEIDSRPVVIQRARIMRHRSRLESWRLRFSIEVDEDILPLDDVHQMLGDGGKRSGIGDFRPQKGGPFGRYKINSWKVQK